MYGELEVSLSGKTPTEGAEGAKETTGAARADRGRKGAHPMGDFGDGRRGFGDTQGQAVIRR